MNNIFINNLQMETQTVFCQNGSINIFPCAFELGQHIVAGGNIFNCPQKINCVV